MIVIRNVFHAKFGKGDELVAAMKESMRQNPGKYEGRVMTDLSGPFFTMVVETILPSLADVEKFYAEMFSDPSAQEMGERMQGLIRDGYKEYFTIVE